MICSLIPKMDRHERILTEVARSAASPEIESALSDFNDVLHFFTSSSRSEMGRKRLGQLGALAALLEYLSSLSNTQQNTKVILKIIRNLCAGEIINQSSFVHDGGLQISASLANSTLAGNLSVQEEKEEKGGGVVGLEVWQMILQVLGNVALAGAQHQSAVWCVFFPTLFARFAGIRNAKTYEPLCMVIYTCCKDSRERMGELCGSAGSAILVGLLRTSQTVGIEGDWLNLLIMKICFVEAYFVHLFSGLKLQEICLADTREGRVEVFSLEQASLLRVIANFLTHQMEDVTQLINSKDCRRVLREFVTFIIEIVQKSLRNIDFRPVNPSPLPTGWPAIDVLGYSLNILRDICACEDPPSSSADAYNVHQTGTFSMPDSLISSDFIELMIDLLQELGPPEAVKKATRHASSRPIPKDTNQSEEMEAGGHGDVMKNTLISTCREPSLLHETNKACPYSGYRRDIVSILANATFRRKCVQDRIRECGGLFLLLQQCVVDEKNPFLREWGLWAIRNLLEGNRENQKEVAELELQKSVNMPSITEMGLRVEIDPTTKKPKLINIAAQ